VVSAAFSADGRRLISGSWDKTARVWDVGTGTEVARMTIDGSVRCVTLSPDGHWAATGDAFDVCLWETATGAQVRKFLELQKPFVTALAFSPDGRRLASAAGTVVRVWELTAQPSLAREMPGTIDWQHDPLIDRLVFSADGGLLAGSTPDGTIQVWDLTSARRVHLFRSASPDDLELAVSQAGRRCRVIRAAEELVLTSSVSGAVFAWFPDNTTTVPNPTGLSWAGFRGNRVCLFTLELDESSKAKAEAQG
jgi:WD40 repeat protein